LILVARESPLSLIHLRNLTTCAEAGAMIFPPMVTYYNKPLNIEGMNNHIVAKILDKFGIEVQGFKRWGENH
jgi:4-hydroxy-3-polyprenylbenzoate decarboxylase